MPPTERAPIERAAAERRRADLAELALGTDRFHEPRRTCCPWCGGARLRTRLRTGDLFQHMPGTFVLDQCQECAHCFQNPRLTAEGRDFYLRDLCLRDFGDGLGAETAERILGARHGPARHRAAVRALLRFGEPESWLDVGTGQGAFPAVAREDHPYIAFDGLDTGVCVEQALAAGHLDEAHRGTLTGLAPRLAGRYDALSMFHHLEHRPDPREELRAARTVLRPGGHLLIETPDPLSRCAALLGAWWGPYLQPRRLHLIPLRNLRRGLEDLGFTVVAAERREAHLPLELTAALALLLGRCLPAADVPWRAEPPGALRRTVRTTVSGAALPALAAARGADRLLAPLLRGTRFANAYRIIARRDADSADSADSADDAG